MVNLAKFEMFILSINLVILTVLGLFALFSVNLFFGGIFRFIGKIFKPKKKKPTSPNINSYGTESLVKPEKPAPETKISVIEVATSTKSYIAEVIPNGNTKIDMIPQIPENPESETEQAIADQSDTQKTTAESAELIEPESKTESEKQAKNEPETDIKTEEMSENIIAPTTEEIRVSTKILEAAKQKIKEMQETDKDESFFDWVVTQKPKETKKQKSDKKKLTRKQKKLLKKETKKKLKEKNANGENK